MAQRAPKAKSKPLATTKSTAKVKSATKLSSDAADQRALGEAASRLIDEKIASLGDWRGQTLTEARRIIREASPEIVEEWKWMGTPVWSLAGNLCTGETYKQVVKLTFARGAFLPDLNKLFNSSLDGNLRRAIDLREGERIDAKALKTLVQAAIAENLRLRAPKGKPESGAHPPAEKSPKPESKSGEAKPQSAKSQPKAAGRATKPAKSKNGDKAEKAVTLLSGGNPQIAKGDGDAPVQAYIAALADWKRDRCKRLDALIERTVPEVRKAVKWNSPFYGVEGQGWFLSFHVFTHYLKATFFRGTNLKPIPIGGTERSKEARWIDIRENDTLDEAQMKRWIKQAAALPGWIP